MSLKVGDAVSQWKMFVSHGYGDAHAISQAEGENLATCYMKDLMRIVVCYLLECSKAFV